MYLRWYLKLVIASCHYKTMYFAMYKRTEHVNKMIFWRNCLCDPTM